MELVIETGRIGSEWRAAALADGELVAEAWGKGEAEARAALSAMMGNRAVSTVVGGMPASTPQPSPSGNPLRDAITAMLRSHPELRPEDRCPANTKYMDRYRTLRGRGVSHEVSHAVQHIWVAAEGLPSSLDDIRQKPYPGRQGGKGRHSNLKAVPDLKNADLVRFSPENSAEARRIIDAVAGLPPTPEA